MAKMILRRLQVASSQVGSGVGEQSYKLRFVLKVLRREYP